jgi:hypothetical protein
MAPLETAGLPPLDVSFQEDPRVLKQAATEDYSLHLVPHSWRSSKWSLAMAWWAMCSGMFYIVVAGTIALAVGTRDALIGIALSVVAYGAINWVISWYAAKTGLTVALVSRKLFGYGGAVLAPLIFGATAIYYTCFEGSVISVVFKTYFGGPLKVWYLVVILYSIPFAVLYHRAIWSLNLDHYEVRLPRSMADLPSRLDRRHRRARLVVRLHVIYGCVDPDDVHVGFRALR